MNTALRLSIVTLIVFCGPGPGLAAQADTLQRKPKQIVAVYHCDYPPVSFLNKNTDNADGFFVDIMNSVAERAGLRATYICKSGWPEMMHAIQSGEADLGALMKSEEREKKLAFSSPIDTSYLSFFARSQSSIDPDRLPAGCTVGVIKGSMSFEQLKKKPGLRLQTEDSYQEGIFSLLAGEISLFAGEESMILKRARETKLDDRIRKTGKAFLERERGLAVRKDNAELVALLNKALDGFIGSQEYQTIYLKWYGVPTPYWTVNKILIVCGSFLLTAVSGMAVWRFRSLAMINRELVRNITERKKAERSLEQSKAFNAKILETVDEGFIVIDAQFKILSANNAYLSQVKLPLQEVLGKKCHEISHHLSVPCHEAGEDCSASLTFASGNPHIAVHRHQNTKGGLVMVEIKSYPVKDGSGKVISVIEVVNNITDKINLEAQVSHSQKLEAVGHLAGGIAHDFNNILTAIIGYGSLAKRKMKKDDPAIHDLQQILESADRAANLTRGLLAFSRKQIISPRPVNVNDIVKNIEKLIMRLIGEDIVPQIILTNRKATVLADSGQIEQILMNLTTNARDAMPEGGSLIVRTETAALGDDFIRAHGYGKPGMYVLLSVQDSGRGMDGKTKESIFEPFFTTKEVGRGTGLGLSIVYGIVKQHNGYIECDTELGKGTTFKIYLPMIRGDFEAKDDKIQPVVRGGTETVLVAEDDHAVRSLIKEILTLHGYSVIEAANGEDAIAKFKEHSDSVHALLLDVLMPGKSGKDVYDEIRGAGHDVKAIFMSGYTADVIHKKGILDGELAFIAKPVTPSELLSKLRDALGAGQAV
jgi:PAS domain S-box-containing protein